MRVSSLVFSAKCLTRSRPMPLLVPVTRMFPPSVTDILEKTQEQQADFSLLNMAQQMLLKCPASCTLSNLCMCGTRREELPLTSLWGFRTFPFTGERSKCFYFHLSMSLSILSLGLKRALFLCHRGLLSNWTL